jgi:hypothetical protein
MDLRASFWLLTIRISMARIRLWPADHDADRISCDVERQTPRAGRSITGLTYSVVMRGGPVELHENLSRPIDSIHLTAANV